MKKINFFNNGKIVAHTTDTTVPLLGSIIILNVNSVENPNVYTPTRYGVSNVSHNFKRNVSAPDTEFFESDEVDIDIIGIPLPAAT